MRIVLIVLVFALTLYALLDCARTPEESMPARMPKFLWITLIVLFPTIGPIAWIIVSRVKAAEERGGYVEPTVWSSKEGTTFRARSGPGPWLPTTTRSSCGTWSRTSAVVSTTRRSPPAAVMPATTPRSPMPGRRATPTARVPTSTETEAPGHGRSRGSQGRAVRAWGQGAVSTS